jgi:hypothetical protein
MGVNISSQAGKVCEWVGWNKILQQWMSYLMNVAIVVFSWWHFCLVIDDKYLETFPLSCRASATDIYWEKAKDTAELL